MSPSEWASVAVALGGLVVLSRLQGTPRRPAVTAFVGVALLAGAFALLWSAWDDPLSTPGPIPTPSVTAPR